MVGAAPALLREWDTLQSEVVPPLLEIVDGRQAKCWSIGSVEDAVAVGVAYEHAKSSDAASMQIYAGGLNGSGPVESGFTLSDLRCLPDRARSPYFVRHERKWVVEEDIAERVILGDPVDAVDLVTLRPRCPASDGCVSDVVSQLCQGGQLLLVTADPDRDALDPPDGVKQVAETRAGIVYRKHGGCALPGRPMVPEIAVSELDTGERDTLARRRAQDELVGSHIRLAASLARRFAHRGESAEDLQQVAMLALVKAAKRFDPDRETRFATYATTSILGELKRHFRDKTWMLKVSRPVQELYLEVKQARDELTHTLGASPSLSQIADCLRVPEQSVREALQAAGTFWPASLEGRAMDDPSTDVPIVDTALERSVDRVDLQRLLPGLDSNEQLAVRRIYFDDRTQRDVAAELGVSQMQVSRLLTRALKKLRT
jgi:RNA polymerase sigma-B factor